MLLGLLGVVKETVLGHADGDAQSLPPPVGLSGGSRISIGDRVGFSASEKAEVGVGQPLLEPVLLPGQGEAEDQECRNKEDSDTVKPESFLPAT